MWHRCTCPWTAVSSPGAQSSKRMVRNFGGFKEGSKIGIPPHSERLMEHNLFSLQKRSLGDNLITVWKYLQGKEIVC